MTAKRRTLTITHPDNTTSTRTTTADYLYAVERGPVDSGRWARNLELRAIEADKQADNAETLLKDGFKTLRRNRGIGDDHRYNDFELTVQTNDRTVPNIGESVHTYCNYDRQSRDYVHDADGNPVRAADGQWTEIVRPGVDILREYLERLVVRRREIAESLREQIAAGPSREERSYTVLRWSKSAELAGKAAQGAEFAYHRAAGHPLTVVKVDQAHEGYEPGVYISPADRQAARRAAHLAAVNATVLTIPAADELTRCTFCDEPREDDELCPDCGTCIDHSCDCAEEPTTDEGAGQVAVILDEADPAVEQVERSVCRYCHGRIVRRTHRPDTKWRHDKGDKGSPRGCTPFSQSEATPTDMTAEYRVMGADEGVAELPDPDGSNTLPVPAPRPVVAVDMTDHRSGIVLVTGTGRAQSPQAHVSVTSAHGVKVWTIDSEYTDNDGGVEPIRLTASTLPYVVAAFVRHLGLDPWNVDYRFEGDPVYWHKGFADEQQTKVSPSALAAAVMTWNADRSLTAARWNFNSSKNFAARLFGQYAAVVEINDDRDAYTVAIVDVLDARTIATDRVTVEDVLDVADAMLRRVRRDS